MGAIGSREANPVALAWEGKEGGTVDMCACAISSEAAEAIEDLLLRWRREEASRKSKAFSSQRDGLNFLIKSKSSDWTWHAGVRGPGVECGRACWGVSDSFSHAALHGRAVEADLVVGLFPLRVRIQARVCARVWGRARLTSVFFKAVRKTRAGVGRAFDSPDLTRATEVSVH